MGRKKYLSLIVLVPFLVGCRWNKGPYKVTELTELRSANELETLPKSTSVPDYSIYSGPYGWTVYFKYSSEVKNIVPSRMNLSSHREIPDSEMEDYLYHEERARQFAIDYFVITSEKLPILFPVNYVNAYHVIFKKSIFIEKYQTESSREKKNYRKFEYSFNNGFLFLLKSTDMVDEKTVNKDSVRLAY